MNENTQNQITKRQMWYSRLDRFLLFLLTGELGLFLALIVGITFVLIIGKVVNNGFNFIARPDTLYWLVWVFIITVTINFIGGFISLVLNIQIRHQGYPGTGHLLNWIFIATTSWIFILVTSGILTTDCLMSL